MTRTTCDVCGELIDSNFDMIKGKFHTYNYHDEHLSLGSINIFFEKDTSMIIPAPDICRKCLKKKIVKIFEKI